MDQQKESTSDNHPILTFIWGQYRIWDATAGKMKKVISKWRKILLIFIIGGTFLGIITSDLNNWVELAGKISGISASLFIAFTVFINSKILTSESEKDFIRCRAMAETLKSEAYLYHFKGGYYKNHSSKLKILRRIEAMVEGVSNVAPIAISRDEEEIDLLPSSYSIDEYVEERIEGQAYQYFIPKAKYYQKIIKRGYNWGIFFGLCGIILGTLSSAFHHSFAVWVAFTSSVTASVATFMSTNRYEYLVLSYHGTANRLKLLLARYKSMDKTRESIRHFVEDCELTLASENSSWFKELASKEEDEEEDELDTNTATGIEVNQE